MSTLKFFKRLEQHYNYMLDPIIKFIEESGEFISTTHVEIDFTLRLICKLRLHFNQDSNFTAEALEEILKGGHIKFEDDGLFYNELIEEFNTNLRPRFSSHKSSQQQFSLSGPVIKEVLFGVTKDEQGKETTWMQFENNNTKTLISLILHLFDYIMHKLTGKNIGPYGTSNFTEKNPFIIS